MKKLLIVLVFIPILSYAQDTDIIQGYITPGNELLTAKNIMNAGAVVSGLGLSMTLIAIGAKEPVYANIGLGLLMAGFVVNIVGVQYIGKAGKLMNDHKWGVTFNQGVGIRYRI